MRRNEMKGGRISDIQALENDFRFVVIGSASGGVWKTTNAGTTWKPIFDRYGSASIGSVGLFQKDSRIITHPTDPGVVYAAAPPAWSPDSRFIAVEISRNANTDLFAVDILSKEKQLLTNTAYDEGRPLWSPDGRSLLFTSNRFGHSFPEFSGKWDLYQLHLEPQKPEFEEDDFEKLFRPEEDAADKNDTKKKDVPHVELTLKDIDRQTQPVTDTLGDDREFILNPKDGTTVYFVSTTDGPAHLWTTSLDKKKRGKYEPFVPAVFSPRQLQTDSKGTSLYYLSRGAIGRIDLGSNRSSPISFSTRIEVDKTARISWLSTISTTTCSARTRNSTRPSKPSSISSNNWGQASFFQKSFFAASGPGQNLC
ncbi:MAG: hypothetical protein KJ727_09250 [Acidobacteria bacterium]|nr:hypothetical protein [Acidobacteriota bacterium]MBU4254765.1 hypothetical protein [Acidobacteriota bacterium]